MDPENGDGDPSGRVEMLTWKDEGRQRRFGVHGGLVECGVEGAIL